MAISFSSRGVWGEHSFFFHLYDHLAAIFVPSIDLEGVIAYIETLTKFSQQALSDLEGVIASINPLLNLVSKAGKAYPYLTLK